MTNNITEVVERVPETVILTQYIQENSEIEEGGIETVELTVGKEFNEYTVVTETSTGVKQYEYLVNTQTKEVKEVDVHIISE